MLCLMIAVTEYVVLLIAEWIAEFVTVLVVEWIAELAIAAFTEWTKELIAQMLSLLEVGRPIQQ